MSQPRAGFPAKDNASLLGLRLCVAATCATAAWMAWSRPTAVNGYLFMELGLDEHVASQFDRGAALLLALAALALLGLRSRVACGIAAAWLLTLALAKAVQGGEPFAHLAPAAHAVRYGAPLALLVAYLGRERAAFTLLRWCVAATFAAHGWEALQHTPAFIDLTILSARDLFDVRMRESSARALLTAIGYVDLGLALLVVVRRWQAVAAYMALWGALTLASRVTALGPAHWPEAAIRIANAAAPLALLLHWRARARRTETH